MPSSSMLEPIIVPKLLIHFADFPYVISNTALGYSPLSPVAVRYDQPPPFYQTSPLLLRITLRRSYARANSHPLLFQPSSLYCYPRAVMWIDSHSPFLRFASPPSIQRMNPTQCINHNRYYFQDLLRVLLHTTSPSSFSAALVPVYQCPGLANTDHHLQF